MFDKLKFFEPKKSKTGGKGNDGVRTYDLSLRYTKGRGWTFKFMKRCIKRLYEEKGIEIATEKTGIAIGQDAESNDGNIYIAFAPPESEQTIELNKKSPTFFHRVAKDAILETYGPDHKAFNFTLEFVEEGENVVLYKLVLYSKDSGGSAPETVETAQHREVPGNQPDWGAGNGLHEAAPETESTWGAHGGPSWPNDKPGVKIH